MKSTLWLLVSHRSHPAVPAVAPTLAWMAEDAGAQFEMYLEADRDGQLFAQTGSTVLGGRHFQQFNYLAAVFDLKFILLGETALFRSSIDAFRGEVLASGESAEELYRALGVDLSGHTVIVPGQPPEEGQLDLRPYYYQDIYFQRVVGLPGGACPTGDVRSFTVAMAERWVEQADGVAFGDPDAILSMLATLCRERRVTVFGPSQRLRPDQIEACAYAEEHSSAVGDVRRLCEATGNRVIVGRQTGDGDLFEWSKAGVAIKIMDPNRPPFPVAATVPHRWHGRDETVYDHEPSDATLEQWADEGKRLASMLVHSGEMAHNEAMLNLIELCAWTGLKLGIGVHAARYQTCPQLWELVSLPRSSGGALGLVEPVLHTGGLGIMTENTCPPSLLAEHCRQAQSEIAEICGEAWLPRGYLTFMDSDMATFTQTLPAVYQAIESCGLSYTVSCALPGRNRILSRTDGHVVLNQSTRSICTGSPYVRVSTVQDLRENTPGPSPGWWLGVIDAPVIAFNPYIWRRGASFIEMVDHLIAGQWTNVTPTVVARYARILNRRGLV